MSNIKTIANIVVAAAAPASTVVLAAALAAVVLPLQLALTYIFSFL